MEEEINVERENIIIGGSGTSNYNSLSNKPKINNVELNGNKTSNDLSLQEKLVSGTNIKTINNQSLLGNGNITIEGGGGGTSELSTEVKNAILDCFEHVAWTDANGQTYYDALEDLFFPPKTLVSISAVFNQGSTVIYDNASLDDLKQYLTVTALYDDESTETVTNYSLSGTLSVGTSTITVSYGGKTDTFNVTVTAVPVITGIEATYTQGSTVVYDDATLDSLKTNLVVEAVYSDSSKVTLDSNDYILSGTLSEGTSTITVTYSTFTTTFTVTVTARAELSSISAVFTQGNNVIYDYATLDDLKQYLTVIAYYTDSTTSTVTDYTLSGALAVGTSTITVSYGGKTATFNVTVTEALVPAGYTAYDYLQRISESDDWMETPLIKTPSFAVLDCETWFSIDASTTGNAALFGCRTTGNAAANKNEYAFYACNSEKGTAVRCTTFGTPVQDIGSWVGNTVRHFQYYFNSGNSYVVIDDGEPVSINNAVPSADIPNQGTYGLYLCAVNQGGEVGGITGKNAASKHGKIVFYTSGTNTKVYEFIPAYNGSKYGYYERVNGVFYPQKYNILVGGNY